MDLHRKVVFIVMLILSNNTKLCLYGAPSEESVINTEMTGQELIKMGNQLNKPLLSLLGATFVKVEEKVNLKLSERIVDTEKKLQNGVNKIALDASEKLEVAEKKLQNGIDNLTKETSKEREILKIELCKMTRCAAWTEWSRCSANKVETFGAKTRSRRCGGSSPICSTKLAVTVETDHQICQGRINCKHTLTDNNYCIKLYRSPKKTQAAANNDCHKDGGHLMNIDSALKLQNVFDYFLICSA